MAFRCCTFAAAVLLTVSIGAVPARACVNSTDVIGRIEHDIAGATIAFADGLIAERITAGISAVTGDAVPAGGSYVLVDLPAGALTYVVRIAAGCATHHGRFPRPLVRIWIEGQAAENQHHD